MAGLAPNGGEQKRDQVRATYASLLQGRCSLVAMWRQGLRVLVGVIESSKESGSCGEGRRRDRRGARRRITVSELATAVCVVGIKGRVLGPTERRRSGQGRRPMQQCCQNAARENRSSSAEGIDVVIRVSSLRVWFAFRSARMVRTDKSGKARKRKWPVCFFEVVCDINIVRNESAPNAATSSGVDCRFKQQSLRLGVEERAGLGAECSLGGKRVESRAERN
ncbi:hypothetical protein R3P38DRAFT_3342823 [Favolaschia claudopus]|uniref:Uncharacterized protein n=1 Tax=Favolaschia claudopus TaxID=2862362 RepID=A0AAW0DWV1_9AGAR